MATLRLERGGKKLSRANKFRVFIDGDEVGALKKWGDSAEFEVAAGTHTLALKAFGGVNGSAEAEFAEGQVMDLLCGYGKGAWASGTMGGNPPLQFWEREN